MASVRSEHALDSVSVAAGATETSAWFDANETEAIRAVVDSVGADITVDIEGSPDDGTTTYTIASGITGGDQVRDVAAKRVRLSASNSGSGSQTVDAWLLLRGS